MSASDDLAPWRVRWGLTADGEAFVTPHTASRLQPVLTADGRRAMLKLARADEEIRGNAVMAWWNGRGAAEVLAHDGAAILLERLDSPTSLVEMSRSGDDDRATEVLCEVTLRLHRDASGAPALFELRARFRALERQAQTPGPDQAAYAGAWAIAQDLLNRAAPPVALHGDMHHANVLQGERGWMAIDPKGVFGDAGYDFANMLNNPDPAVSHAPGRLARQARVIADCTARPLGSVLGWAVAYAALSASWSSQDGNEQNASLSLATARIAQAELASLA